MNGEFFTVANWNEFQHYKERNPPWVKLHYTLLSGETWVALDDASRVLAIACMLIASRHDGRVPANPAFVQRVAYLNHPPNFKPLIESGFLVDASGVLAGCKQDASNLHTNARPETETEKRREEKRRDKTRVRERPLEGFADFWSSYPRKEAKAAAEKAWAKIPADAHQTIMAAIEAQKQNEQWMKDGGAFIPHASTWLNQRRWEDEVVDRYELDIERRAARLRALG